MFICAFQFKPVIWNILLPLKHNTAHYTVGAVLELFKIWLSISPTYVNRMHIYDLPLPFSSSSSPSSSPLFLSLTPPFTPLILSLFFCFFLLLLSLQDLLKSPVRKILLLFTLYEKETNSAKWSLLSQDIHLGGGNGVNPGLHTAHPCQCLYIIAGFIVNTFSHSYNVESVL